MDLVSVIIPCYNRAAYLRECLLSVASQSYPAIEVIVVDDASHEDIQAVMRGITWPHSISPHYIRCDQNKGPGAARETGRLAARGEFICYLDADDLWHEDKVAVQVEALQENPHAGMCYCIVKEFQTLPLTGEGPVRCLSDQVFTDFLPHLLQAKRQRPWGTGACMWTRSATDQIGPWFPGRHWEDLEYDCRAGCHRIKITYVPRALCFYRKGTGKGRLNEERWQVRVVDQTPAVLEIARDLHRFGQLKNAEILDSLIWFLFDHSTLLLKANEKTLALQCLQQIASLQPSWINTYSRLVAFLPSQAAWASNRVLRKYFAG